MWGMEIIDPLSGLFVAFVSILALSLVAMMFGILLSHIASILFEG
jgi:hypothetical protein